VRFIQKNGIVTQYSILGEPQQNGVAERRNRILMDIVINMLNYFTLPIGLLMDALKTVIYILYRVPVNQCLKHNMSYRLDISPRLITFEYGTVLLRLRYLTQILVN
jgi:transposase InsO family protein